MRLLRRGRCVHIVGIGGSGMSAIARVLHGRGYRVSGSDRARSALTDALTAEGIDVHIGHSAENLSKGLSDRLGLLVVVSSAVSDDNAEVVEARRRGVPVVKRAVLLQELTQGHTAIAVAGTHGKTTTTAMIAWILMEAGLDPTFIAGSTLQNLGTNARAGLGPHFVVEADEYDRTFLGLRPQVALITIVEHDHPDCFPTFRDMQLAFAEFADCAVSAGCLIVCGDDPEARNLGARIEERLRQEGVGPGDKRVINYGFDPAYDWQAAEVQLEGCPTFEVRHRNRRLGKCALQLPGRHNVLNGLAAIAASSRIGVDFDVAAAALTRFRGTARRFEVKGQIGGVTVVDDYAHHPTEIRATLAAARTRYPGRPIWAVFQPHTFSRTAALLEGFAKAFDDADHVLVTSIFSAREQNTLGVSGADVAHRMCTGNGHHPDVSYVESLDEATALLLSRVQSGDLVVTLGAGDGYLVGERLLEGLRHGQQ